MDVFGIFISPFVQATVDKLSSYLINLVSTADVGTGIQNLKKALEDLETLLADAENKQVYDKDIKKWLEEVQPLAYDADDLLDDFATEALERKLMAEETTMGRRPAKFPRLSSIVPFNLKNGFKLNEITSQLQEVATKGKDLGLDKRVDGTMPTDLWQRSQTTCLKEPHIHGRDEDMKQIIELLLGDAPTAKKFDVIPIVGMGGIGKTTLVQHIYDHDKVEKHFNMKAWVCVSVDFDILGTTKAILESFTHRPCDLGKLNEVQVQLRNTLAEKKFLLVLDDVWHYGHDGWNSLRLPFDAGAPGSKIIVTTRQGGVVKQMGMDEYLNLKNLLYDDCWLIFAHHAFENRNIIECPELVSIGKKIVKHRCGGLPLAARALGSLLRCKQAESEWKKILNSNIWNEESGILSALKLSYLHLPSHLKRCFSYCAIIPMDYEFKEEELVLLWMAEGLIKQPKGGKQMEDLGRKYFHELVSRSFFQPSSGNKLNFIMHDLINDLAQNVAGDKCFRFKNNLEYGRHNKISDKARHSSYVGSNYEGIKKFKVFDDAKCLRTFLQFLPPSRHASRYLFHDLLPKLKCLRELRLHCARMDELPDSIGDLKHLRYLDVSYSGITRLPDTVVTLYNLQVLFLKFCSRLQKLPLNIGRLVNLRHFDMTGVNIPSSEEMSPHIGKLTSLQTLSNFMVGKDCGRKIGELKNLSNIRGAIHISRLENVGGVKDARDANFMSKEELKELSLEWDESHRSQNDIVERDVLDVMRPFKLLERLTIIGYGSTKFPNWVGDVSYSKMVFMRLKGSKYCISLPPLGQLPLLKDLYIEGMSAIKCVGCEFYGQQCGAKPFPSLERLSFKFMPEWEDWSAFENEGVQPFGHLSELSIINCPKLVGRLPNDLPCLNSLKIDGCPQLLIDVSSLVQPSLVSLSMNNVMLPSLPALLGAKNMIELGSLTLDISHVTVPDSLCDPSTTDAELLANAMSKHLTSIIALSISHVEKLAFLPTWFTRDLRELKKLDITNCQELITLWRNKGLPCMTARLEYLTIEKCGMLKKLPQDLHTYTSLGVLKIYSCESLISFPMKGLPSMLRELEVSCCHALESLPELMTLNNLQELKVSHCASLTYLLSRGGLPSTLKQLQIKDCRNLESLFAEEGIKIDCPSLETICVELCGSLKSLPEANNLRNLSELEIEGCPNLEPLSLGGRDENNNINQLTSLQKLCLVYCRAEMVSYFVKEGSFPTNITSLEIGNLRVGQLPVPPPSPLEWGLHKLSSLTTLHLDGGGWPWGDTVSFPEEGMFLPTSLINLTIDSFPNLERLSYEEFQNLTSLEELYIMVCPKLASFPKEGLPPSLLHLWISGCPELATFPEQGFPPSLLSLWIVGCNPILKQKCEKGKEYWPIIQYIPQVGWEI
ncbi:putative disease resistance RPP13-like protein 1 [Camellia sinensis]|uniref:putative disease resistance RPP13-like protein 1 n=1 Tax=Camellia sinensis TaxID=4442 RepID=UPI001036476A|nr:putative disease resistance RPP13-like protein 1 [Camellia sinensis]